MHVLLSSVAAIAIAAVAFTQTPSPRETAKAKVGGESVSVEYGRPSLNGRSFSELTSKLPEDRMWRAGSEQVTTLTVSGDVYVGDSKVPAGEYSLYVYCPADGEYALAVNEVVGQPLGEVWAEAPDGLKNELWPHFSYTEDIGDSEVARVPLAETKTSSTVDMFTIALEENGDGAVMKLAWGEAAWSVPVKAAK